MPEREQVSAFPTFRQPFLAQAVRGLQSTFAELRIFFVA